VEGFESRVLAGAKQTLSDHKPLLYIEGANRVATVVEILEEHGYRYGDFHQNAVRLSDCPSTRVNGFFLHASRLDEYRRLELLID